MTKKNYLCPTCGRRCIGFNSIGRCENKRYQPDYRRPRKLNTESPLGSYVHSDDCGQTVYPAPREG